MILNIWRLMVDVVYDFEDEEEVVDEGTLAGVRIQTTDNLFYDLDIDTFREHLGNKVHENLFDFIALEDYDGDLLSEDEVYQGLEVYDGDENEDLLDFLQEFKPSTLPNYRKRLNDRKAAIHKLVKEYEGLVPFRLREQLGEFLYTQMKTKTDYWGFFNQSQIDVLTKYFKWATKMMYRQITQGKALTATLNKTQKLLEIMGDSQEWDYAGTLDTGYFGGGVCTLGHAVRYEHYAYDRKTGKQVIFGVKCFSDFFELDQMVVASITNAQQRLAKEMVVIAFLLHTNQKDYFGTEIISPEDLRDYGHILSTTKKEWVKWTKRFKDAGLPLTMSFETMRNNIKRNIRDAK